MTATLEIVFWLSAALIVWTQLGYAVALAVLARLFVPTASRSAVEPSAAGADAGDSPRCR